MYLLYFYARTSIKRFNTLVHRSSAHGETFKRVRFRFVISETQKREWKVLSASSFIHHYFLPLRMMKLFPLPLSLKSEKYFLLISQICNFIFLERELEPIHTSELSRKRVLKCYNATGTCLRALSSSFECITCDSIWRVQEVLRPQQYINWIWMSFTRLLDVTLFEDCPCVSHEITSNIKCWYRGWKHQIRLKHS